MELPLEVRGYSIGDGQEGGSPIRCTARPDPRFRSPGGYECDCARPDSRIGVQALEPGEQGPGDVARLYQARPQFLKGFDPVLRPGRFPRIECGRAFGAHAVQSRCAEEGGHLSSDEVVDARRCRPLKPGLPEGAQRFGCGGGGRKEIRLDGEQHSVRLQEADHVLHCLLWRLHVMQYGAGGDEVVGAGFDCVLEDV